MLKRTIALLLAVLLCVAMAACGTKSDDKDSKSSDQKGAKQSTGSTHTATGKPSKEELVYTVFDSIDNNADFSEIEDSFDESLAATGKLIELCDYYDDIDFQTYRNAAADFDRGSDYIIENYPDIADALFCGGHHLPENYDEVAEGIANAYNDLQDTFDLIKKDYYFPHWDSKEDVVESGTSSFENGVLIFGDDLASKEHEDEYDPGNGAFASSYSHQLDFCYVEIDGKFYGLSLSILEHKQSTKD